jgi:hypothetical protein
MTLWQFKLLIEEEQVRILVERGVYLDSRSTSDYHIALYQVDGFYIELYHRNEEHEVVKMIGFSSTKRLEPYLSQIDIASLF